MKRIIKVASSYFFFVIVVLICIIWTNEVVTSFSESRSVARLHCIVIDPGHGGEDGGAVSYSGLPESLFNLQISIRLNDLFHLLGYDTKMIRVSDVSVYSTGETISQKKASDLKERVNMANNTDGAVLLSIHQNYFSDPKYYGAQVFYAKTDRSEDLAKKLQDAFVSTLNPGSHRMEKESKGIYLMEHVRCPAVLVECGFLSNIQEENKLKDPEYQRKLCAVIAVTTAQYLSNT